MYSWKSLQNDCHINTLLHHDFRKIQPYLTKPILSNLKKYTCISLIGLSSHCLKVEAGRYMQGVNM